MPRRSWRLRVEDTLQAIDRIRGYVAGYDLDRLYEDQKSIDAVIRNLEIVWKTIHDDLPKLQPALAEILNDEPWRTQSLPPACRCVPLLDRPGFTQLLDSNS